MCVCLIELLGFVVVLEVVWLEFMVVCCHDKIFCNMSNCCVFFFKSYGCFVVVVPTLLMCELGCVDCDLGGVQGLALLMVWWRVYRVRWTFVAYFLI